MRSGVVIASKYRIVKELGSGGMGSVWQAVNLATEREFAIKFLHAALAKNQGLLTRFFQEAKVSGKLRHPSIIEIFDVGAAAELDGTPFLVMEMLDGASLDVLMHRTQAPVPPRIALESMAEIARALSLAHDKGIVHRDLKPANIFLHRPGTGAVVPKVLDFGISKFAGAAAPDLNTGLTQTGAVLGSPLYMSPEQAASDKSIDGRSDVHALGVVLWECLVGSPPFTADTYNNLVVHIITGERPSLHDTLPGVSPGVAAIVERAMKRKREDRFQSAAEMADALEAEIARLPPSTSITSRTAAAEVFGRMRPASVRPPEAGAPGTPGAIGTTTGGMSVPSVRGGSEPSPAAFTMPESRPRSSSETAFAATQVAVSGPGVSSAEPLAPTLASAGTPPLSATSTRSRRPALAVAAIGGVLVIGAIVALTSRHGATAPITPDPSTTGASLAPTASTSAAPAEPATSATASATAAAPVPTPAPSVSSAPAAIPARPASAAAGAATKRAIPAKKGDDSVQSSGF